jgi:spore maturation protein CgeB
VRFALFVHSLVSDWNHGNAHFLRGVMRELIAQGHEAVAYEPGDGWSRTNLLADQGEEAVDRFAQTFPGLRSVSYDTEQADLDRLLDGIDAVIVHEWNDPSLVARIGEHRRCHGYVLLFHDTHHRAATSPHEISRFDLSGFDGVLCFGEVIREIYLKQGWAKRAWTWHEAADTSLFRPGPQTAKTGDLVWIGNWGDGERSEELREYLLRPIGELGLSAVVYGVRYPPAAVDHIAAVGARYGGWLANASVPAVFAAHRLTVHVPRRPYVEALPGIPTIRVFEALACGIPLICASWSDSEALFRPGRDYLVARNGGEMTEMIRAVLADPGLASSLAASGLETIRARHTCAHRAAELLAICATCRRNSAAGAEVVAG